MNTDQRTRLGRRPAGFSLVELLTAIAILGIITGLAVPLINSVNNSARTSVARRNAQTVSSTFAVAKTAGVSGWNSQSTGAQIVVDLMHGVTPIDGPFAGRLFVIPNLPSESSPEFSEMMSFLDWDALNVQLNYNSRL